MLRTNIYEDKGYLVLATVYGYGGLKENTKTKKVRPLPIIPEIAECLKPQEVTKYLFTFRGQPYSKRTHEKIWSTAMQRAHEKYETPIVSMYQGTKHSFGCQRLNDGYTKDQIKAVMGHTDTKTTDRYAKYLTENLTGVMRGSKIIKLGTDLEQRKVSRRKH
jgi:integrase